MNLLSLEQALELINKARISSDPDVLPTAIRQIQANAFRAAVDFCTCGEPVRRDCVIKTVALFGILAQANQLDPQNLNRTPGAQHPIP